MSSEGATRKRKRPAADGEPVFSVSLDHDADQRRPTPMLAFEPGFAFPASVGLDFYEHKRGGQVLHGEQGKMEYNNEADATGQSGYSYMLAVHRKSTGTTSLLPVPAHEILATIRAHRGSKGEEQSELTLEQQRNLLGQTFGTKKAQKRIAAAERNKIDVETEDLVALQPLLLSKIEAATATLPTKERVKEEADAARPVPEFDLDATVASKIYSRDAVAPPGEYKAVPLYNLLTANTAADRIALLPFQKSRLVNDRVNSLCGEIGDGTPTSKQKRQLSMLFLIAVMMAFKTRVHAKNGPRSRLDKLGLPPAIVTGVGDRFSEKTRGGKHTVTPLMQKKIDNYLCVMCLMASDYNVDTNLLAEDLLTPVRSLQDTFRGLGCDVYTPSASELDKLVSQGKALGITVTDSKLAKRATLTAPLTFPDARKKRASGAKR